VDLAGYSFYIRDIDDFLLLQNLHCHFLASSLVNGQLDFAEGALAQRLFWMMTAVRIKYSPILWGRFS
jgi:hypothetical protein